MNKPKICLTFVARPPNLRMLSELYLNIVTIDQAASSFTHLMRPL
ncbi:MAG: hypothetical protein ALAOOOJD_02757 [bacterium]|nr:hypothetical protein [bacterium]